MAARSNGPREGVVRESTQPEQAVDELLGAIEKHLPRLTSRPGLYDRQIAAAGLARCCALSDGIRVLCRCGRCDVAGVLTRTLYETFIVSLYVLLKGHEAFLHVAGAHKRHGRILNEKNALGAEDLLARWTFDEARLNVEELTKELGPLLAEAGEPDSDAMPIYDLGYRAESTWSTHGLGALLRYVDAAGSPWTVVKRPEGLLKPENAQTVAVLYTSVLAKHVFQQFGVGLSEIERLFDELAAISRGGKATPEV